MAPETQQTPEQVPPSSQTVDPITQSNTTIPKLQTAAIYYEGITIMSGQPAVLRLDSDNHLRGYLADATAGQATNPLFDLTAAQVKKITNQGSLIQIKTEGQSYRFDLNAQNTVTAAVEKTAVSGAILAIAGAAFLPGKPIYLPVKDWMNDLGTAGFPVHHSKFNDTMDFIFAHFLLFKILFLAFIVIILLTITVVVTVVNQRDNHKLAVQHDNKVSATHANPAVSLVDYTSPKVKFSMQVPKGWQATDTSSDANHTGVQFSAPYDNYTSSLYDDHAISVSYIHQTDKVLAQTEKTYFAGVGQTVVSTTQATYPDEKATITSENDLTLSGHDAHEAVVRVTGTDNKVAVDNTITKIGIYIDSATYYEIEIDASTYNTHLLADVDAMAQSFTLLP
jgi:hypothetical protein